MNGLLNFWNKFFFGSFDPFSVSIFRIFLGTLMFVFYIANFPNWERFYAPEGLSWLNPETLTTERWWSIFSWTHGTIPIKTFWWVGFFSTVAFTMGFQTRLATIFLYIIQSSMNTTGWVVVNGEDSIFRMFLLYSCFAPLNFTFSLDSYLKRKRLEKKGIKYEPNLPLIWPIRLLQINFALVYLVNIPNKLTDDFAWINGTALYWTVANDMWSRGKHIVPFFYMWDCLVSKIATYSTLVIEGTFPFLVCFGATKLYAIAALAMLHIGIAILNTNVTFFTLSMVCGLWVFVPAEVTQKIFSKAIKL